MIISVPTTNGNVAPDFGRATEFTIFHTDIFDEIEREEILPAPGEGFKTQLPLLLEHKVQVLICGGIGGYAVRALRDTDIMLMGGASGPARERVLDFLGGTLRFYDMSEPLPARPADGDAEGTGDGAATDGNIAACAP